MRTNLGHKNLNEQGFTLIEVMISAALFGVMIVAISAEFSLQRTTEQSMLVQQDARAAMNSIANNVWSNLGSFPDLQNSSGAEVTYVGCFSSNLSQMGNYIASYTITTNPPSAQYCVTDPTMAGAAYEIQVTHTQANGMNSQAQVFGFTLPTTTGVKSPVQVFVFPQLSGIIKPTSPATQTPLTPVPLPPQS